MGPGLTLWTTEELRLLAWLYLLVLSFTPLSTIPNMSITKLGDDLMKVLKLDMSGTNWVIYKDQFLCTVDARGLLHHVHNLLHIVLEWNVDGKDAASIYVLRPRFDCWILIWRQEPTEVDGNESERWKTRLEDRKRVWRTENKVGGSRTNLIIWLECYKHSSILIYWS